VVSSRSDTDREVSATDAENDRQNAQHHLLLAHEQARHDLRQASVFAAVSAAGSAFPASVLVQAPDADISFNAPSWSRTRTRSMSRRLRKVSSLLMTISAP
jgi:hypothetical protein